MSSKIRLMLDRVRLKRLQSCAIVAPRAYKRKMDRLSSSVRCPSGIRENCQRAVVSVEVFQRVTDRFRTAVHLLGELPRHFRERCATFDKLTGSFDDLAFFIVAQLAESLTTTDLVAVGGDKSIDTTLQKPNPFATAEQQSATNQPSITPAADGFG